MILSDRDDTANWVEKLFHGYVALGETKPGFLFSMARRLITVSLIKESIAKARERFKSIEKALPVTQKMLDRFSAWISSPGSDAAYLVLNHERFRQHLRKEVERLFGSSYALSDCEEDEPVANSVLANYYF